MKNHIRGRLSKGWLVVALLVVGVAALFFVLGSERFEQGNPVGAGGLPSASEEAVVPVAVSRVATDTLTRTITVNGQIIPVREVAVVPKVSGTVQWIVGDIGDRVEEGQVILRLEDEELVAQLQQAEAALQAADANLARLRAGATAEEREQAQASLRQAEVNLEQARRTFERMHMLHAQAVVSQEQFEGARSQYEVAQASYATSEQQVKRLEKGATPEDLRAAEAQVAQARAARDLSRLQLERAEIKAPIAGLIARRHVEVGGMAQIGSAALVIVDIDQVYVRGTVSQSHVNRVVVGATVPVEADALGQTFAGRVHTVSPAADNGGLFPLRVQIDNEQHVLRPGMFARIHIPIERAEDAPTVPTRAIVRRGESRFVYVVEENTRVPDEPADSGSAGKLATGSAPKSEGLGTARLRRVELGVEEGDRVAVTEGLQVGELVVLTGQGFLSDGQRVRWTGEE